MPPPAIKVDNASKAYTIWTSPAARLHGPLLGRLGQLPFLPPAARRLCQRASHDAFRNYFALRDVSLEIPQGASVGILGRNGSGKSTLLQLLAGTLMPTSGDVTVTGNVAAMLELGSGFDGEFTGRENVYLSAAIRGLSQRQTDAKFDEIAAFADIGEFIDQPVKTYSSGMLVRLAFAVSACIKPEVLLVDEALSVGDIFFQQKCVRHMKEGMAEVTKVFVTHDLHAVRSVTEFAYVLDRGEIVYAGASRDAVEYYIKMSHNGSERTVAAVARPDSRVSPAEGMPMVARLPWLDVTPSQLSGLGEVSIRRVAVTRPDLRQPGAVQAKDRICVHLWLTCAIRKPQVIAGYILSDRMGHAICGENSCSLADGVIALEPGDHLMRFEFDWPDIHPGDYSITLGIGDGNDPLRHVIQCWAHNVVKFTAVSPGRVIHCIFNNPMANLGVAPIDDRVCPGAQRTGGAPVRVAANE